MKKVTLTQVRSLVKKNGELNVQLFPSNCGPANTTWVKGYEVKLIKDVTVINGVRTETGSIFDNFINMFIVNNCNKELGNRVHYYIED